jgi:hypothetical protein
VPDPALYSNGREVCDVTDVQSEASLRTSLKKKEIYIGNSKIPQAM